MVYHYFSILAPLMISIRLPSKYQFWSLSLLRYSEAIFKIVVFKNLPRRNSLSENFLTPWQFWASLQLPLNALPNPRPTIGECPLLPGNRLLTLSRASECFKTFLRLYIRLAGIFLDAQASLAPTHLCPSVRWWYFWISILSVSLVALREKLKRDDPNYFSILGLGKISWNWSGEGGQGGEAKFFFDDKNVDS